jgi:hypothetical protein
MKKNESHSIKTPFTSAMRVLAVLFGIGFILGFLLTPLGVETRSPEIRTLLFAVFFIIVGLLIPLAGLVLLWLRKTKYAGVLAVIGAALIFITAPADQALVFFTVSPPPAVTLGEFILIFVGIGYILYGPQVYAEKQTQDANLPQEPKE